MRNEVIDGELPTNSFLNSSQGGLPNSKKIPIYALKARTRGNNAMKQWGNKSQRMLPSKQASRYPW